MEDFSLSNLAFSRRRHEVRRSCAHPLLTQERVFRYLINKGRRTAWGRQYGYKDFKDYKDFQSAVPISSYEDLRVYIERLLQGENYILWPEKIKYFSKSSGTTGSKSKYIPVSASALNDCHYRGGRSLFATYFAQNFDSNLLLGQNFALGGSRQSDGIGANKYIADVSAILMKNLPWWAQLRRSPRFSVAAMGEWEEKLERIAEIIAYQNIVSISGVPSWNLVLAKKILEITGKKNLREVWPNLELFIHGGISFAPYRSQFEALIPGKMNYLEVYNASEGFFAFQDDLSRSDMLLFLNGGVFYEFVPLSELSKSSPRALTLAEVELDKHYALVISTNAGLWRYLIGDTVKFTCLNPFRIIISGRTKSFINACGEELVVENAEQAVQAACVRCQAIVKEYTAAPKFSDNAAAAYHEWLFEFEQEPLSLSEFARALDEELKKRNSDYEAKRYKDLNLSEPVLMKARPGLFYNWLKANKRLGGQSKIPRLANDRQIFASLLALNR
ncbi:MAG: GH3 auxin-responsive promoter family protein [Patescibacteria group bacterium]|nr:GH3 auxin-responsive promoter family protein [Patescibacteria group bacterium]